MKGIWELYSTKLRIFFEESSRKAILLRLSPKFSATPNMAEYNKNPNPIPFYPILLLPNTPPMQVQLHATPQALAEALAAQTASAIAAQPVFRLCAATGNSPTLFYQALVQRKAEFAKPEFRLIQLDEWGGVPPEHPGTCISYLQQHLIGPLGLKPEQCITFQSNPVNPLRECARVQEALIAEGTIDLCVLGLGANGHLAFNEPGAFLQPFCHVARLSEESLQHSMAVDMPHTQLYGLTLGMADILSAQKIVMIVNGYSKREILQQVLHKQVSSRLPASFLWLHPKMELWVDEAAWPG